MNSKTVVTPVLYLVIGILLISTIVYFLVSSFLPPERRYTTVVVERPYWYRYPGWRRYSGPYRRGWYKGSGPGDGKGQDGKAGSGTQ